MRTHIKHYEKYLMSLMLFAAGLKYKIEWKDKLPCGGILVPKYRVIYILASLPPTEKIATLLHELGHAIDDNFFNFKEENLVDTAYKKTYSNKKVNSKYHKIVMKCEKAAWNNGRNIAAMLGIRLGLWYTEIELQSLETYK